MVNILSILTVAPEFTFPEMYSFTIQVVDNFGETASKTFNLAVN